jgi:hypothetical protein
MTTIIDYAVNTVKDIIALGLAVLEEAWRRSWAAIQLTVETAIGAVNWVVATLVGWLQSLWDKAGEVAGYFEGAFKVAIDVAKSTWEAFSGAVEIVIDWLQDVWDKALEVAGYFEGAFGTGIDVAKNAWDTLAGAIETVIGWLKDVISWAGKALSPLQKVIDAASKVKDIITADIDTNYQGPRNPFLPENAAGGVVRAMMPGWVGERGRELFVPAVDGRILSHHDSMQAMRPMTVAGGDGFSIGQLGPFYVNGDSPTVRSDVEQGVLAALAQYTKAR